MLALSIQVPFAYNRSVGKVQMVGDIINKRKLLKLKRRSYKKERVSACLFFLLIFLFVCLSIYLYVHMHACVHVCMCMRLSLSKQRSLLCKEDIWIFGIFHCFPSWHTVNLDWTSFFDPASQESFSSFHGVCSLTVGLSVEARYSANMQCNCD